MRKTSTPILLFVILSLATACIHKTGGAVTPWERVHTYNASIAEANNALEQGAEAAVASNLIPAQTAAPIIGFSGQVAALHLQITAILQQGSATTANISAVRTLVAQIKASLSVLPPAALGIKNPKSTQTFQSDVQNIGTLADSLLAALQAVTGTSEVLDPYRPQAPIPYAQGGA